VERAAFKRARSLPACDEAWECRHFVELVSSSFDSDRAGIGSSPYVGDMSMTGVRVPAAPTPNQSRRYLIRLCGIQIPDGKALILRGLRQAATIRSVTVQNNCPVLATELEVTSPFWSFKDGNISWHLRLQGNRFAPAIHDPAQQPGTDTNLNRLDSALIYVPPLVPYVPPSNGLPPAAALEYLGTWYDMRYPWENTDWSQNQLVKGPHNLVFYASVHQPDPAGRVVADPDDPGALRPEDRFLATFPAAIYGRVAGAMLVETMPFCPNVC
jgi:hypothetical protein